MKEKQRSKKPQQKLKGRPSFSVGDQITYEPKRKENAKYSTSDQTAYAVDAKY
jgi:hypothetical protein